MVNCWYMYDMYVWFVCVCVCFAVLFSVAKMLLKHDFVIKSLWTNSWNLHVHYIDGPKWLFIQGRLYISQFLAFPGNWTHDFAVVSAMLYCLIYRNVKSCVLVEQSDWIFTSVFQFCVLYQTVREQTVGVRTTLVIGTWWPHIKCFEQHGVKWSNYVLFFLRRLWCLWKVSWGLSTVS